MLVAGPAPVVFVPPNATVRVGTILFDMVGHTFSFAYQDGAGLSSKTVSGPIGPALLTALQAVAARAIEANEGWAANSSTPSQ